MSLSGTLGRVRSDGCGFHANASDGGGWRALWGVEIIIAISQTRYRVTLDTRSTRRNDDGED
jgi:hypothetical protein